MQSYVEEARKRVGSARARLERVEQQLSVILAECVVSTTENSTLNPLEHQAMPPRRASRLSIITLKDLRSDKSSRPTLQGNKQSDKNKKLASANPALSSIHSSKVSKAAGRKASRSRRQSTIPAEHGDGQGQGSHITVSSSWPANVTAGRNSRLGNNQKKSGALEADLAAGLDRSVQILAINVIIRRSDRISKQKERISTSNSKAVVNSTMPSQKDPSRLSRFKLKDRHVDNRSDPSPIKPRGISKRQKSKYLRNRTKIHSQE